MADRFISQMLMPCDSRTANNESNKNPPESLPNHTGDTFRRIISNYIAVCHQARKPRSTPAATAEPMTPAHWAP